MTAPSNAPRVLRCGAHRLDLGRPRVMAIVNVTPDSFFDGGSHAEARAAIAYGEQALRDGAAIVDVGGESTRPGAAEVSDELERSRVVPVVRALASLGALVSVDTSKPSVMAAAIDAGAAMVNDVRALQADGALSLVASADVGVCLMHMQGEPRTMQQAPHYDDVVREVRAFLAGRAAACAAAGVAHERIVLDPGFGFGKTLEHNLALLRALPALCTLGYPVLAGLSRKGSIGRITGRPPEERLAGSVAAALAAVARGAAIVRVHDVRETVDALAVWEAVGPLA